MSNLLGNLWQRIVSLRGGGTPKQNRRLERSTVRIPLKARILGTEFKMDEVKYSPSLGGYTRNLSEIGLAIELPAAKVGGLDLVKQYRRLRIALDLPSQSIEIFATAVYFKPLRNDKKDTGYLIGARITKISPQDSELLKTYLITSH